MKDFKLSRIISFQHSFPMRIILWTGAGDNVQRKGGGFNYRNTLT